jgi:hypothetical protein
MNRKIALVVLASLVMGLQAAALGLASFTEH